MLNIKYKFLLLINLLLMYFPVQSQNTDKDSILLYSQQLISAIATGDPFFWNKYLDDSCLITTEDGTVKTKQLFIKGITAPSPLYKVTEKLLNPIYRIHENVIVICYTAKLSLEVYGQQRLTQISQTDTWMKKQGKWQLISSEALDKPDLSAGTDPDSLIIKNISGKYRLSDQLGYDVFSDSGKLFIIRMGSVRKELICESDFVFFLDSNPLLRYVFVHNSDHQVTGLNVRRQGSGIIFPKIK